MAFIMYRIQHQIAYLILTTILFTGGCTVKEPTPSTSSKMLSIPSVTAGEISNPKLDLASFYQFEDHPIAIHAASYSLPLTLTEIINWQEIEAVFQLKANQRALLGQNGFVAIPWHGDDIIEPYKTMKEQGIPIFVTCDTLLHLYHIQFNEILKRIEEEEFFDRLIDMSQAMLNRADGDYQAFIDSDLKEAARRNVAYFAVGLSLLQTSTAGFDEEELKEETERWNEANPEAKREFKPIRKVDFTVPDYVKKEVDGEIRNINEHEGFKQSVIFNSDEGSTGDRICCYYEDYSQYVPRGHYTRSEVLKRYFKAMMWYGRMAFLLKGGDKQECTQREGPLVTEEDAKLATIQALLISAELSDVKVGETDVQQIWNRIYSVTSFFVGTADDLTPYEYLTAIEKVFGTQFETIQLVNDDELLNLKAELAQMRNPEIYGGSGICVIYPPITREKLYECLAKTKGMRFMGQRYVPDSYIFQNLVSPAVGMYANSSETEPFTMKLTPVGPARAFPRGLDVMAVLGSERAYNILKEEGDTEYQGEDTSYESQLSSLRMQFSEFKDTDWNRNLYWAWLYALRPLLQEYGEGYPEFMQTQAWQDKGLTTCLASWTELRHDTILYAKQSYTPVLESVPPPPKPVVGYVEPVPDFYARMLALTKMTRNGLAHLDALSDIEEVRLNSLEEKLDRLLKIAKDELDNKELGENDFTFIRNFGEEMDSIVAGVETEGKETTLIADVHTDANEPRQVLEEGIGHVDLILVAYQLPDSRILVGAGPVLSYYEFKQPINNRLTDEAWKEILEKAQQPERPRWIKSYYGK